jgi:Domain of unknown function (DUF4190)
MPERKKDCPYCGERILARAAKCRYCGEYLDESRRPGPDLAERMLLPTGRPATAIISGYMGLFAFVPLFGLPFAIAALVTGIMALRAIGRNRRLSGKGRAWFGIIVGGLMTLLGVFFLIAVLIDLLGRRRG